jgi:23S rRNA (pseudouridine1915-N3)-methyltransferase
MKVKIICVGKIKEKYLEQGIAEYLKRLASYTKVEIVEINETKLNDNPSARDVLRVVEDEGKKIMAKLSNDEFIIALDVQGQNIDNQAYVSLIEKAQNNGYSTFTFVIGGSYGLSDALKMVVDFNWSFSKLVFTHQMIRMLLLEQIYRGFKIMNNEPYHK